MIRFLSILTCILIQTHPSIALAFEHYEPKVQDPVLEPWRWQSFPQLQGPGFRAVVEDASGHMWFGTDAGVKHYDGITWTDYTTEDGLHGAPINVLCAAKDGSVYAGSRKGISRFKDGSWHRVFPIDPKVDWTIWSIREAQDGTIWSGTARGALCISPNGAQSYYTTNDCADGLRIIAPWMTYVIVPDALATPERWGDGIGVKVAVGLPPDGGPITGAVIRALAPSGPAERAGVRVGDRILSPEGKDSPPNLNWDGPPGTTSTLKLRYLDESQIREVKILRETVTSKFSDFWIFDAYPDTKGAIWFAVRTGELIRYNGSSEAPAFERFDAKDGIDIVGRRPGTKLVESPDGLLWVVTSDTGGLNRFDGKSWSTSKLADLGGSDQNASIGVSPGGTLWVGGESTLHTYHGGQWTIYRAPESPIPDGRIIIHADKQNRLWIGGVGHGISNLDLGQDHFQTYQDLSFQFTAKDSTQWYLEKDGSPISFSGQWSRHSLLKEDFGLPIVGLVPAMNGGVLAVGDELGTVEIAKLDDGHWQKMTRVEITGSVNPPSITVLKDGGLWFGSEMAAYQYVGQKIKTYSTGFPVHAIGEDQDNTVWVSSQTNLYRLEGQALKQLANPDALSRTISQSILSTTNKDLWIGTEFFGLFQFSGESWIQHNIQNGLPSNNITDIVELPSGHIVISTNMGFSRYDGETWSDYLKDVPNAQRGGLRVETNGQLRINTTDGRTLRYIPKTRPPETMITVSIAKVSHPGNTVISWGGIAPWKAHSDQLMFSYRLDDTHWSTYASPTNKVLLSLPSGKHTFEVRARDTDFNVDPSPARLAFHVAPPIWREPWLVLTAIFLIIAGIFQTIRIVQRDRELQDKNEDLQIARTDLARRVKLRTQELMEANKKLILEVAEREKTERELIHLERLRAVGEMSAGISHNLNNMLTGILAPAQMVKSLMTDTEGQFYVDTILKSAERARDLIERLHNAVRGQRQDTLQPVHVNQVIHDAIQTARPRWKDEMESRGIEIELLTNLEPVPDIKATQSGLHDILVNLIFNAVDAMPKGGAITVATKESNNCVIISVRDTGVGMNEETKARVFEPFFTTKMNVGTGLGLFTVHGEINRWNGNIDITSMPEEGTTFTIELPTWVTPRIEAEVKEISHKHSAMGNKILLVDDESIVRDVVVHELSKQHQIVAKINGISALESFAGQNYDIAIIDLGLPGIPGDILAKKIKEQDPAIVTILITGWMLEEDDPRLNPFDFRLQKPLDAGDLHRIVTLAAQLQETRQEALGT